jgi:hypothetical protein
MSVVRSSASGGLHMQTNKVSAITAAVVATAAVLFATVPSRSQTAPQARPAPAPRAAVAARPPAPARPPATVTVRKRSFLDPGTETKTRREHDLDYAQPDFEYGYSPMRNSTLFTNGPSLPFTHDRMPFPTCLDLAGFCQ